MRNLPQLITPDHHPSEIAVFEAANMGEALHIASDAYMRPGIKAAIWKTSVPPIEWQQEENLREVFRQTLTQIPKGMSNAVLVTHGKLPDGDEKYLYFKRHGSIITLVPDGTLDPVRSENILTLAAAFRKVNVAIRHEYRGREDRHVDGKLTKARYNAGKLFFGNPLRVLSTRHGPGTLIYEGAEDDKIVSSTWQMETGDYLFFTGKNGISPKALWHSAPPFTVGAEEPPRVLDAYDLKPV